MYYRVNSNTDTDFFHRIPDAIAMIKGSEEYQSIKGTVKLYQTPKGVMIVTEVSGLPTAAEKCEGGIFAFHIHNGVICKGNVEDPFADVGAHYNPGGCPHPYHAGDMPPLFSANGVAFMAFLSNRFTVSEVIGKTVIIHDGPDDFMTQPSGNSGNKIACGEIGLVRR